VTDKLYRAEQTVSARQRDLNDAQDRVVYWQEELQRTAGLHGLTRRRREEHHRVASQIDFLTGVVEDHRQRLDYACRQLDELMSQEKAGVAFDQANSWRVERIRVLEHDLQEHWALAVLDSAKDGYPAAHGIHCLQAARNTIINHIETLADQSSPGIGRETPTPLDDPLRALADLDRAVTEAATKPALRLAEPRRALRVDVHTQYQQFVQAAHEPPAPSASIGL
jgi:hypothetical protein